MRACARRVAFQTPTEGEIRRFRRDDIEGENRIIHKHGQRCDHTHQSLCLTYDMRPWFVAHLERFASLFKATYREKHGPYTDRWRQVSRVSYGYASECRRACFFSDGAGGFSQLSGCAEG